MGFLDNVLNKSVPQGSSPAKPLLLALGALLASGALTRKQSAPDTSSASEPGAGGLLGGLGGLLEKLQQSGHGEIMGRQRAKSADLAWPAQFGARSIDYKGFGPKDWFVRTRTDSATVASPTRLRRQADAAGAPSNA